MSVRCGTLSDMSDKSDKSDFIGVPQVQKKRGRQNIGFCNSPISPLCKGSKRKFAI